MSLCRRTVGIGSVTDALKGGQTPNCIKLLRCWRFFYVCLLIMLLLLCCVPRTALGSYSLLLGDACPRKKLVWWLGGYDIPDRWVGGWVGGWVGWWFGIGCVGGCGGWLAPPSSHHPHHQHFDATVSDARQRENLSGWMGGRARGGGVAPAIYD